MKEILIFLLICEILFNKTNGLYQNAESFGEYGIKAGHLAQPQFLFGDYGTSVGSPVSQGYDPNYDPLFASTADPKYYFQFQNLNSNLQYPSNVPKMSNKKKERRFGDTRPRKPCDELLLLSSSYSMGSKPSKTYSSKTNDYPLNFGNSMGFASYEDFNGYGSQKQSEQTSYDTNSLLNSKSGALDPDFLPFIKLLTQHIQNKMPIVQNVFNPNTNPLKSDSGQSYQQSPHSLYHRTGDSINNFNAKKKIVKVGKIILEDMSMDKRA